MDKEELNGVMQYEYDRIQKNKELLDFGIEIKIENEDYTKWDITLTAPEDSDYKGGVYKLEAKFELEYPLANPTFTFKTKIYHCNVDDDGKLKVNWLLKGMKIDYILPRILTLFYLQDTSVDENSDKCKLYKENKDEFMENVKKNVEQTKNN